MYTQFSETLTSIYISMDREDNTRIAAMVAEYVGKKIGKLR